MKKIFSTLIAVLFLLVFQNTKADVEFANGSFSEILEKAKLENKIIMIDFVTDWCKWCVETDRKVYTNAEVYEFANSNQINWKIDAEKGEGPDLAKRYGVKGFPTIVFTQSDGAEIDRIYGYLPAEQFLTRMKEYHLGVNTFGALKKAVEDNPNDPAANFNLADKIVSNGLEGDAKTYLNNTISNDPGNTAGYTDDAKFLLAYLNEDESALSAALKEYPTSNKAKDAYINLASFYAAKPDFKMADAMYKEAFRNFGENDVDLRQGYGGLLMGEAYATMKDEKSTAAKRNEAIAVLEKCLPYVKGSVNEASAYYIMSDLYLQNKDFQMADQCIDKSILIYDKKSYRDQKEKIGKQKTTK